MHIGAYLVGILLVGAAPAWAQGAVGIPMDPRPTQLPAPEPTPPSPRTGQIAESAVGRAGVRQTGGQVRGVDPMARIYNRVQNRVQARMHNRIDRNYDPRANATSPFEAADQAVERASQRPR